MKRTLMLLAVLGALTVAIRAEDELTFFGEVARADGVVRLFRGGEEHMLSAEDGIFDGDTIVTEGEASVEVSMGDGNDIVILPASKVSFDAREEGAEGRLKIGLKLDLGSLRCKLDAWKAGDTFEVRSPVAVAGVRGTDFLASYDEKSEEPFEVSVLNGQVEMRSQLRKMLEPRVIFAKHRATASRAGDLRPLREIAPEKIEELRKRFVFRQGLRRFLGSRAELRRGVLEKLREAPRRRRAIHRRRP